MKQIKGILQFIKAKDFEKHQDSKFSLPKLNLQAFRLKKLENKLAKISSSVQSSRIKFDVISKNVKNQHEEMQIVRPYRYSQNTYALPKCQCQFHKYGKRQKVNCKHNEPNYNFITSLKNQIQVKNRDRYLSCPKISRFSQSDAQTLTTLNSGKVLQKIKKLTKFEGQTNLNKIIKKAKNKKKYFQSTPSTLKQTLQQKDKQMKSIQNASSKKKQSSVIKKKQKINNQSQIINSLNISDQKANQEKIQLQPSLQLHIVQQESLQKIQQQAQSQNFFQKNDLLKTNQQTLEQQKNYQNPVEMLNKKLQQNPTQTFKALNYDDDNGINQKYLEFNITISPPNPNQNINDYIYLIEKAYLQSIQQQNLKLANKQQKELQTPSKLQKGQNKNRKSSSLYYINKNSHRGSMSSQYSLHSFNSRNFLPPYANSRQKLSISSSKNIKRRNGKKGQQFPKFASSNNISYNKSRNRSFNNKNKTNTIQKVTKKIKTTTQQKYKNVKYQTVLSKLQFSSLIDTIENKEINFAQKAQYLYQVLKLEHILLNFQQLSKVLTQFKIFVQQNPLIQQNLNKIITERKAGLMLASLNKSIDQSMRLIKQQNQLNKIGQKLQQEQWQAKQQQQNKNKKIQKQEHKYRNKYFLCQIMTLQKDYLISKHFDALNIQQNMTMQKKEYLQLILQQKQLQQFQDCSINRDLIQPCIHHGELDIQKFKEQMNNSIFFTQNKHLKLNKKDKLTNKKQKQNDQKQNKMTPTNIKQKTMKDRQNKAIMQHKAEKGNAPPRIN